VPSEQHLWRRPPGFSTSQSVRYPLLDQNLLVGSISDTYSLQSEVFIGTDTSGPVQGKKGMGRKHFNPQGESAHPVCRSQALVGEASLIAALKKRIEKVSLRDHTVLIRGESGSGKELVARAIHAASRRAVHPFVAVDCTTLRDTLFESQLFGHVRGAFTGAEQATLGFFRTADEGTLFLDEIGELPPHIQAKLLRCIQEGAVVPLGSVEPIRVNVRIVAATHRDLQRMVREGAFRGDLYYRLNVVCLDVPALRDRREDIPALARFFLEQQASLYHEPARTLAEEVCRVLCAYHWPGNVRELANAIEHACAFSEGSEIQLRDLPPTVQLAAASALTSLEDQVLTLEAAERLAILQALRAAGSNRAKAAQLLQIERHRLYRKIRRYQLHNVADSVAI